MEKIKNNFSLDLFLVVLGGRAKSSHIELHDVRWVVGRSIEETIPQLRKEWFGSSKGLHIDSYVLIKYIDGYEINLRDRAKEKNSIMQINNSDTIGSENKLWFVNMGGYSSKKLYELHEFSLIVAKSASEAMRIAKQRLLKSCEMQHKDDINSLHCLDSVDNINSIEYIQSCSIELIPDKWKRSQLLQPDWYGYMRIDK